VSYGLFLKSMWQGHALCARRLRVLSPTIRQTLKGSNKKRRRRNASRPQSAYATPSGAGCFEEPGPGALPHRR
jgi:hypothetical protein